MTGFYQQFLTDKSWQILTELNRRFRFVLIGGWAVYLYTNSLKSKDIDMIVDFGELEKLRQDFSLEKNERLKKYQIKIESVDIDIYLPHYSVLGVPAEILLQKTVSVEGFTLPRKELLLLTKLTAFAGRRASVKGQKDLIDITSLILLDDFDFSCLAIHDKETVRQILAQTREVGELNQNRHRFAKIKKELLAKLAAPEKM